MAFSENLIVMFTDIVNYTRITARQSRAESEAMLRQHDALLLPIVATYGGHKVKSIGDALMIKFRSPTDAVHCGMAMQDALAAGRGDGTVTKALHIRVAINLGEVRVERNDLFGEPVNVAARLESITPGDEVYFSEAVYLAMNKAEVPSEALGPQNLKGIPEPINIYRVPSFTLNRLIPVGDRNTRQLQTLPFAGAHTRREPKRQLRHLPARAIRWLRQQGYSLLEDRAQRRKALMVAAPLALIVAAAVGIGIMRPAQLEEVQGVFEDVVGALSATHQPEPEVEGATTIRSWEFLEQGEALLQSSRQDELAGLLAAQFAEKPEDPQALVLRGHLAYERGDYSAGAQAYGQALKIDPQLIENQILADNLVASLGWVSADVRPILLGYHSTVSLEALRRRTGQEGFHGRVQAAQILSKLGRPELIDRYNYAREELLGRSNCEDRLEAVRMLREIGDRDAIPLLKSQISGMRNWWRNGCLREEARTAIRELEALES